MTLQPIPVVNGCTSKRADLGSRTLSSERVMLKLPDSRRPHGTQLRTDIVKFTFIYDSERGWESPGAKHAPDVKWDAGQPGWKAGIGVACWHDTSHHYCRTMQFSLTEKQYCLNYCLFMT